MDRVMLTQRIALHRALRIPGRICGKRFPLGVPCAIALALFSVWLPAPAESKPVSPLAIDRAFGLSGATPWVSPTGEQLVTYLRRGRSGSVLPVVTSRIAGGPFSSSRTLSGVPAISAPVLGFGPDGSARLAWQDVRGTARQVFRPAGRKPRRPASAGACTGPVALATSAVGRTLSACRTDSGAGPPWTVLAGVGQMPSRLAPGVEVMPPVRELTGDPLVAWGTDGTGIVVFGYRDGASPGVSKIGAGIVAPDGSLAGAGLVDSAPAPARLVPTGVAVLPNGTTAITADSSDGALLFTRSAGSGVPFERIVTGEDAATMPAADKWGRLHFLGSTTGASGRKTWSSRVLDLDGSLRDGVPVPTQGTRFEPAEGGFQVFPNGAEALVMKSPRRFSVFFRSIGPHAFLLPRELAKTKAPGPGSVTQTPAGDLLLAWKENGAGQRRRMMLGGWDANGRPVIERLSVPRRVRRGARVTLSVVASDPMGIRRIVWKLPGDRKARGAAIKFRFREPGVNRIRVSVFDRAGKRKTRSRRVKVFVPGSPAPQGRGGTSGSPRP